MKKKSVPTIVYFFLSLCLIISSCKTSKNLTLATHVTETNIAQIVKEVSQNQIDYESISLKAKVEVKGKKSKTFTVHLRMAKDSIMWASITGTMGVEGARILATPDSIFILDKLNKSYYIKPFNFIENYVPFPLDLPFLQNLILGTHVIDTIHSKNLKITTKYDLEEENEFIKTNFQIAALNYLIMHAALKEKHSGRTLSIKYLDYQNQPTDDSSQNFFSYIRNITFETDQKINIQIKFSKLNLNESLSFPFHIPDKYDYKE